MKLSVAKLISKHTKISEKQVNELIEVPPSSDLGDFAFPCFSLAQTFKKSPAEISKELKLKIEKSLPKEIEKTESKGPYLNFFVNKILLAEKTIAQILKEKDSYGKPKRSGKNKKIMIEFSQANTHKAFHVGHIRGTSLGESLSRILEFNSVKVIRANYQGDTGMHVAKWIWCYNKYHKKTPLKNDEAWIASIYVDSVKRLIENPNLEEDVNKINQKLEDRSDKFLNDLWRKTRKLSLDSFEKIYKQLNTHFDKYYFESEIESLGKNIAEQLLKKEIAVNSDGAVIMNLEKYGLGVWVLLRSDGTVLYSAKDLALAEIKFKDYKLDESLALFGIAQQLHSRQLEKTLELMNFKKWKDYKFMHFSEVRLPTGKMSSRTGENILYSDFLKELVVYARSQIKTRSPKISEKELEKRALIVSVAAIKYSMLKQDSHKTITFVKEDAMNFEGNTGPYLLYSYARAKSILRKIKKGKKEINKSKPKSLNESEKALITKLSEFSEIVASSLHQMNPSAIANYSFLLCQCFNEFYHNSPVLNSENESFRLELVKAFSQTIKNALNLLGIDVLEEM